MMMVYAMLSLSYFKMALKPSEWVHTDPLAVGGPRPVFTLRYVEWGVCMSLLLALSCDPASEGGDDDMVIEPPAAQERSVFVQQVHMIANIPVVVGNRISRMPLAPSTRCTFIYIWSSWLALVVEDEFMRWFLLCASFSAYAVAALEQLAQCYIYWDQEGGGEWGALVLFQVFLAGFYGVIYLGAALNLYSWQTEQLAYTFSDVGAKFLHSSFLMSLHRQRNLLRLSQLRRAAYTAAADLQRMIRQASVPIFTVDMDQKVQDWNLKIEEVTGIPRTEAVGHALSDLASGDELDSWWSAAGELLQDAMEERGPNITEMTFNASDHLSYPAGTVMAVSATVLRGGAGEVKGAVCIGQDISAITAEKNRAQSVADGLTRLIDSANTPIFQVDLSDNIVVWNNWLVRTTGLDRPSVLGKHISTVLSPGSKKKFQDACKKVLGSCDADLFEINLVNTGDQKRTLLLTATPCVSLSGQINGAICIGQDITRLKDLDERKASMMAMVSHELKSPLHGIIGLCSSLLDGNADPEEGQVPRSLEMVYNCANRLLDMVANIMDTSVLVNNKKMRMSRDPVQIKDILDEVITLCRKASNGKDRGLLLRPGVQLINNIQDPLPMIEADAYRCTQLLYNLITNAIKFTHEGSVVVSAGYDDAEQRVFVEIEDTGIGIAKANIDRIFEPFDQEDTSESRQYSGLGLGLSISREVVRKHGGDLVVESEQGVGSTFRVSLPYKMKSQDLGDVEDEDDTSNHAVEMRTAARGGSMSQKGSHENKKSGTRRRKKTPDPARKEPETAERYFTGLSNKAASDSSLETATMSNAFSAEADAPTILCVDDDPVHLEVVRSLLTQHALKVYAVADGDQAVQFLKMRSVQLLMLDVMMPGMSGQRVLRSVRKFYSPEQLPIIIVSAVCRQETVAECAKLGADDYIMKPFGRAELLEHVQLHLSKATQARASRKAGELKGIEELASSSASTAMEEPQTAVHVLAKEMERIRSDRDEAVERAEALQKQVEALEAELQNKKDTLLSEEQLKFLQTSHTRQQVLRKHHETMAAQIQRLELLQRSQHKLLSARAHQDLDGLLQIASSGPGSQPPLADPKLLQIRKVEDDVGFYLTSIEQLATQLPASSKEELQRLAYQLRAETNKLLLEMGLKCHELGSADSMLQHQWLQLQRLLPQLSLGTDPFRASLSLWPPTQTPGAAATAHGSTF